MGFISYSLKFYHNELEKLESSVVTKETIYRAKQLLKMLDDLTDEGYTELNDKLEEAYQGESRLRKYLKDNNAEPFKLCLKSVKETDISYGQEDYELEEAIRIVIENAGKTDITSDDAFLTELIGFCKWIGYQEDTAYIFLLRDTLLPYIYYQNKNRTSIYPWLLGRKTLTALTGKEYVDDEIRASVIKALEFGRCHSFDEFCSIALPDIRESLNRYPEIVSCLTDLLGKIKEKHIVVIESGCSGTFPLLLMALDNRIDVRMYTTYPYLTDVYGDKIYTLKYEGIRLFETLYSQDLYFQFADLKNGRFYVKKCLDSDVLKRTLAEIRTVTDKKLDKEECL